MFTSSSSIAVGSTATVSILYTGVISSLVRMFDGVMFLFSCSSPSPLKQMQTSNDMAAQASAASRYSSAATSVVGFEVQIKRSFFIVLTGLIGVFVIER